VGASDFAAEVVLAAVLGSAAIVLLRLLGGAEVQRVPRRLTCPLHGRPADCLLLRDVSTGRWAGVARCSLRGDRDARCGAPCLRVLDSKARPAPPRGAVR
jgi:hypothetical protein